MDGRGRTGRSGNTEDLGMHVLRPGTNSRDFCISVSESVDRNCTTLSQDIPSTTTGTQFHGQKRRKRRVQIIINRREDSNKNSRPSREKQKDKREEKKERERKEKSEREKDANPHFLNRQRTGGANTANGRNQPTAPRVVVLVVAVVVVTDTASTASHDAYNHGSCILLSTGFYQRHLYIWPSVALRVLTSVSRAYRMTCSTLDSYEPGNPH